MPPPARQPNDGTTHNGKPCCSRVLQSRNNGRRRTCSRPGCHQPMFFSPTLVKAYPFSSFFFLPGRQAKKRAPRSGALTVRKRGSCSAAFGLWVPVGFQNPRLLCVTSQDFLPPLRRFYCVKGT